MLWVLITNVSEAPPKTENFRINNAETGIFHISAQKHRLWVLVRTTSLKHRLWILIRTSLARC